MYLNTLFIHYSERTTSIESSKEREAKPYTQSSAVELRHGRVRSTHFEKCSSRLCLHAVLVRCSANCLGLPYALLNHPEQIVVNSSYYIINQRKARSESSSVYG